MSDYSEARAKAAEPILPIVPVEVDEIAELAQLGPTGGQDFFTFDDLDEYEEVDEDEVREDNWESFLSPDLGPDLGIELDHKGFLTPTEQARWDEDPPEPQDSYEDGIGI